MKIVQHYNNLHCDFKLLCLISYGVSRHMTALY